MGLFHYSNGIQFKKTGTEVKQAINQRLKELEKRLEKRDRELGEFLKNIDLMRSYLLRNRSNDRWPYEGQSKLEVPSEDHQRISELCNRMRLIEEESRELCVVRDHLSDDQEMQLGLEEISKLGFAEKYYGSQA